MGRSFLTWILNGEFEGRQNAFISVGEIRGQKTNLERKFFADGISVRKDTESDFSPGSD